MSEDQATRALLHDAVQSTVAVDETLPDGSMLKGWVLVAEWVAPNNEGWLTRISGGPGTVNEDRNLPEWQEQGYLHNALHSWNWGNGSDSDDDED